MIYYDTLIIPFSLFYPLITFVPFPKSPSRIACFRSKLPSNFGKVFAKYGLSLCPFMVNVIRSY